MKNNFYENHRILNTKKIKYLFNNSNIRNDNNNRDFLSLVKDVGVIKYSERGNAGNKTSDRPEKYKMVDVGDLVINPMNVSIGSVGVSKYSGCLSGVYLVLKPKKDTNSNYYHYVFQDKNFQSFLKTISSGIMEIRESLDKIKFFQLKIPHPTKFEQEEIVSFLDDKTCKIDALIQKISKKLILLKDKKNALINKTISEGIESNKEFEKINDRFFNKKPKGWLLTKLRYYLSKVGAGHTPRGGSEVYVNDGVVFLRSQNIQFDGLSLKDVSKIEIETHNSMISSQVKKGDNLLNITGGSIGRCCIADLNDEMNISQHVSILRTKKKLNNYFLNYFLQSQYGQEQVKYNLSGSNREGLTIDSIKDFKLLLPSIDEQIIIKNYLDDKLSLIEKIIVKEKEILKIVKEYKNALITETIYEKNK